MFVAFCSADTAAEEIELLVIIIRQKIKKRVNSVPGGVLSSEAVPLRLTQCHAQPFNNGPWVRQFGGEVAKWRRMELSHRPPPAARAAPSGEPSRWAGV